MKISKEKVYSFIQGTIGDISSVQYQTQWQRLAQMQQSASILLAILAISISLMLNINNVEIHKVLLLEDTYWRRLFIPSIINYFMIISLSIFSLFQVIWPKILKNDLPNIKDLYKEILEKTENKILKDSNDKSFYECEIDPARFITKLITDKYNNAILDINLLVEKNQKNYRKGLIISILSLILTFSSYLIILIKIQFGITGIITWYGMNLAILIISINITISLGMEYPKRSKDE